MKIVFVILRVPSRLLVCSWASLPNKKINKDHPLTRKR